MFASLVVCCKTRKQPRRRRRLFDSWPGGTRRRRRRRRWRARRKRRFFCPLPLLEQVSKTNKRPATTAAPSSKERIGKIEIERRRERRQTTKLQSEHVIGSSSSSNHMPVANASNCRYSPEVAGTASAAVFTLKRPVRIEVGVKIQEEEKLAAQVANISPTAMNQSRWLILLVCSLLCLSGLPCWASSLADYDGATFYKAPVGSGIRIACNGSRLSTDDRSAVSLILWFKNSLSSSVAAGNSSSSSGGTNSEPIYTVDARQRPLNGGARHFVADAYKGRAKFVTKSWPPYLDLAPLEPEDQAEYRCRIDYRSKPRENFLIILFVLVPPKSVQIMDSSGRSLEQIYGPLSEGSDLTLVCLSKGGRPAPALTWKRGPKVIDDSYLTLNDYFALKQWERLWPSNDQPHHPYIPSDLDPTNARTLWNNQDDNNLSAAGVELDLAADRVDKKKQQQQQQQHADTSRQGTSTNSISTNPSLLLPLGGEGQQMRLLASEWRSLAEFKYFQLNESSLTAPNDHHQQTTMLADRVRPDASSRKLSPTGTAPPPPTTIDPSGQSAELLTLPVDESITTAVNVLKVVDLAASSEWQVMHQHHQHQQQQQPAAENSRDQQQQQQLECQASNLHYDLRALIKLFAPPSLLLLQLSSPPPSQAHGSGPPPPTSSGRQLVEAIERALDSNLLSVSQTSAPQSLLEQTTTARTANQNNSEAAALKQTLLRANPDAWPVQVQQQPAAAASEARHSKDDKQASIIYQQLSRPHQLASEWIQQQQQPANSRDPLERSRLIELDVYTRPLDVRISPNLPSAFVAGQLAEFTCTSGGSRPAATLSWFKNNQPLKPELWRQIDEANPLNASRVTASRSKLTLKLERQDHGSKLSCRAENEHLTRLLSPSPDPKNISSSFQFSSASDAESIAQSSSARTIEDSRTLVVNYPPRVQLELGNNILSSSIREGTDIYFVCQIEAQPPVREITWLHNERQINSQQPPVASSSSPSSVIISNNSLVLQRVKRDQRGQYACMASNSEGLSESNRIELRVLHAPVCSSAPISHVNDDDDNDRQPPEQRRQPRRQSSGFASAGASSLLVERKWLRLRSRARFVCQMEANPAGEELEFSWFLNNTLGQRQPLQPLPVGEPTSQPPPPPDNGQRGGSNRIKSNQQMQLDSSQLDFQPESGLDYGQIYCEARNSIGTQHRACLYEIRQEFSAGGSTSAGSPAPDSVLQERAPSFGRQSGSCLAVNVTSVSAFIGCERPPGSVTPTDDRQLHIEIFAAQDNSSSTDKQQLEANLSLDLAESLQQPLFLAITNLRHSTNYLVRLDSAGQLSSEVQFTTETMTGRTAPDGSVASNIGDGPIVQLIGSSETHRAHLMSTLISVRSTNSQSAASMGSGAEFGSGGGVRWARVEASAAPGSLTSRLLESLANTFGSLFHQSSLPAPASSAGSRLQQLPRKQQQQPNNLMDLSSAFLLTSLACLALVLVLALALLLLHRFTSSSGSNRDRSSSSLASSSTLSSPPAALGRRQVRVESHENLFDNNDHHEHDQEKQHAGEKLDGGAGIDSRSSGNPSPAYSSVVSRSGPPTVASECGQSVQQQRRLSFAWRGRLPPAHTGSVSAARATLDMRQLASVRRRSQQPPPLEAKNGTTNRSTTCAMIQGCPQVYYSASTASDSTATSSRVSKSRSSMCLESLSIGGGGEPNSGARFDWLQLAGAQASNANTRSAASLLYQAPTHLAGADLPAAAAAAANVELQQQHRRLDELDSGCLIRDANSPHFGLGLGGGCDGAAPNCAAKCQDYERMMGPDACQIILSSFDASTTASGATGREPPPGRSSVAAAAAAATTTAASARPSDAGNLLAYADLASLVVADHQATATCTNPNSLYRLGGQTTGDFPRRLDGLTNRRGQFFAGPKVCSPSESTNMTLQQQQSSTSSFLAFDESQVQFIELLPTVSNGAGAVQQHSAVGDDFLMDQRQHKRPFLYESNQYPASRLQLVSGQQQWFAIDDADYDHDDNNGHSASNKQIQRDQQQQLQVGGGRPAACGPVGSSSLASSSMASSSFNDQQNSTSPPSSSQTNTTPSNSNTTDVQLRSTFNESPALDDGTIKRYNQQPRPRQSNCLLATGILKKPKYQNNKGADDPLACLCDDSSRACSKQ